MPFMKGLAPIRRTWKYLEAGKIVLKDRVKIFSVHYNVIPDHHKGAREFVFWYLPQLQYKNPEVQVVTFRNLTPSPFIRCFLDDGEEVIIDLDSKNKDEIHDYLKKILGKPNSELTTESKVKPKPSLASFGKDCKRHCICEIPGQVPCPAVMVFPKSMRGKFRHSEE